jgi:DNA-binding MarR family transcriptional regulator
MCLHVQRAARVLGRRVDEALRPLGLTHGQFSLLAALNRPDPARIGAVARVLAMDRTTLTAALKPLQSRHLIDVAIDPEDRRSRVLTLTRAGRSLLARAVPVWKRTHADIDGRLGGTDLDLLRQSLRVLS